MAVVPEIPILQIQDETQIPNRTYKLNFDTHRIIGYVDEEDAFQQAAKKVLYTPRFDCYAYDDQYGSEIAQLLRTHNVTREFLEAEIEFILKDALLSDGRYTGINNLKVNFRNDEAYFSFSLDTIMGQMLLEGATSDV